MAKKKKKVAPKAEEDEISILSGDFQLLANAIERYTQVKEKEFKEWVNISAEVDQIVTCLRREFKADDLKKMIEEEQDPARRMLMVVGLIVTTSYGIGDDAI